MFKSNNMLDWASRVPATAHKKKSELVEIVFLGQAKPVEVGEK